MVKGKIVEASARVRVGDSKKVLTRTLLDKVRDIDDVANNNIINNVVTVTGPKGEVCV